MQWKDYVIDTYKKKINSKTSERFGSPGKVGINETGLIEVNWKNRQSVFNRQTKISSKSASVEEILTNEWGT